MNQTVYANFVFCILFLIVYGCLLLSQTLLWKNRFCGVMIEGIKNTTEWKRIRSQFIRNVSLFSFFILLMNLFYQTLFGQGTSNAALIPTFLQITSFCLCYADANKKTTALKAGITAGAPLLEIESSKKVKNIFLTLYTIPFLFLLALHFHTLWQYPSLPNLLPVHWTLTGSVHIRALKSYSFLLSLCCLEIALILFLNYTSYSFLKNRLIPLQKNRKEEKSKIKGAAFLPLLSKYSIGAACSVYLFTWTLAFFFTSLHRSILRNENLSAFSLPLLLSGTIASLLLFSLFSVCYSYRINSSQKS